MAEEIVSTAEDVIDFHGTMIAEKDITPSMYFDYVKGLKNEVDYQEYDLVIDSALKMLEKTKITGQTSMAKELTHQIELAFRELAAAKDGFDIFVNRKDIEKYIDKVESKAIKIIDIENYEREIPDEVMDRLIKARNHFDKIYIFFTDYTKKETKKVAKARRDKDPIMFGAFEDKDAGSSKIFIEERMFFIADWVDDKCELTLEEIVRDVKNKDDKDITYRVSNPTTEKEAKALLESFKTPTEKLEPTNIFEKIKKKITRKKKTTESKE